MKIVNKIIIRHRVIFNPGSTNHTNRSTLMIVSLLLNQFSSLRLTVLLRTNVFANNYHYAKIYTGIVQSET